MTPLPEEKRKLDWLPLAGLALALVVAAVLYFKGGDPMDHLKILAGYTTIILVFFFGMMVLVDMARGKISLTHLISEDDEGHASMSRFQLLIFTFVIGLSLFLIIVSNKTPKFPEIPNAVLILLGISASTYGIGKAIQPETPPAKTTEGEPKK